MSIPESEVRFDPPPVTYTPELRWLLLRSFGPPHQEHSGTLDGQRAVALAIAHDLAPRIVSRITGGQLQHELGREAARRMMLLQLQAQAGTQRMARYVDRLAEEAHAAGTPVVFLKFAALLLDGRVTCESRPANDLDVLVPREHASRFFDALRQAGFERETAPLREAEHHLSSLRHRELGIRVEIHHALKGVFRQGQRLFADFEQLRDAGCLRPVERLVGSCWIPNRELQLAYLLAHGIAHHGTSPLSYPLLRMVADLVDLDVRLPAEDETLTAACRWIERHLTPAEARAAVQLAALFAAGEGGMLQEEARRMPERRLLDHIIAGRSDERYRRLLAVQGALRSPTERTLPARLLRKLRARLFLRRSRLELRYRRRLSGVAYCCLLLLRPFDILFRAVPSLLLIALRKRPRPDGSERTGERRG